MALVVLSIVEQRLDAVRAVLDGAEMVEMAAMVRVHRATLHRWVVRYLSEGLPGLSDRSHRPAECPHLVGIARGRRRSRRGPEASGAYSARHQV